jgi:HD-GYP domain-containing protein (c-di-GMP phosphodiesterase class II)
VADTYDAMTTNRAYRQAMTHEEAMAELERCAGTQFDTRIVQVFVAELERRPDVRAPSAEDCGRDTDNNLPAKPPPAGALAELS